LTVDVYLSVPGGVSDRAMSDALRLIRSKVNEIIDALNTTEADLDSVSDTVDTLVAASVGETNTVSNVGTAGVGVFKQKTGVDFELKKINAGSSKVTITDDGVNSEVDVDVVEANISHGSLSGAHNLTTDIDHDSITNTHDLATDIDHDGLTNAHNLTTDIDHDDLTNTHNLTTDIDHDGIANSHDLTSDISHDAIADYVANEHLPGIDEDDMSSDSDAHVPTQQSVKKYVDDNIGGGASATQVWESFTEGSHTGDTNWQTLLNVASGAGDAYLVLAQYYNANLELKVTLDSVLLDMGDFTGFQTDGYQVVFCMPMTYATSLKIEARTNSGGRTLYWKVLYSS